MKILKELGEWCRLKKNKVRIWLLSWPFIGQMFGRTIKKIEITTPEGKKMEATVEQFKEKVCAHIKIQEIAPMVWKCMDCDDAYFFVTSKLMASKAEALGFVEKFAAHFEMELHDRKKN